MKRTFAQVMCGMLMSGTLLLPAAVEARQAPDNTANNKQDRSTAAPNADHASNKMSDLQMMKHIRQDVEADKSLGTYGHNVKIVAKHGKVTLRGPVNSDESKKTIEEYARKYAGDGNVTNEITVKGESK